MPQRSIVDAMKSLRTMPERFAFMDADFIPQDKYYKMFVGNWYLVLYQILNNTIYVDFMIDGRQDYRWLF